MAKKCSNCGYIMENNARFCEECGQEFMEETFFYKIPVNSQTDMYEKKQLDASTFIGMEESLNQTTFKKRVLGITSLVFGILALLTLGGWLIPQVIALVLGNLSKDKNGRKTKAGKFGWILGIISMIILAIILIMAVIMTF